MKYVGPVNLELDYVLCLLPHIGYILFPIALYFWICLFCSEWNIMDTQ